ncbi:MAG: hypothetical protein QNJ44_24700 [Rhodobacter sp.]|nr:hypothetical protein [Rhodobacter sp.]
MTVLLAVLGAILGAVFGGALGFFGIILIGTVTGADNQQGALAMGAATAGLPLGAFVGAIFGLVLVLRLRARGQADAARPAGNDAAASEVPEDRDGTSSGAGIQGWIAIAVVAAAIIGVWAWWTDDGIPPYLRQPFPVLEAEIRMPAADPGLDFAMSRPADLRSEIVFHRMNPPVPLREEDGQIVLGLRGTLSYRTEDREIEMRLEPGKVLGFALDLGERPTPGGAFTAWRRVDRFSWYRDGVLVPMDGPPPYFIRTRVLAGE